MVHYIELFQSCCFIQIDVFCYNWEEKINIMVADDGLLQHVVIQDKVKRAMQLLHVVWKKKWGLCVHLVKFMNLSIKLLCEIIFENMNISMFILERMIELSHHIQKRQMGIDGLNLIISISYFLIMDVGLVLGLELRYKNYKINDCFP